MAGMATLGRVRGMESELVPTEPGQTCPISAPTYNHIRKEDDLLVILIVSFALFFEMLVLNVLKCLADLCFDLLAKLNIVSKQVFHCLATLSKLAVAVAEP